MTSTNSGTAESFDAVVVGNGVLGISLALTLARHGVAVALVGQEHRPWSASAAAGAMIGCFGEVTTTLLHGRSGRAKLDLGFEARNRWDAWLAELDADAGEPGAESLITADGTFVLLNAIGAPGVDSDNYAAIRQALAEYGEKYEDVDPSQIDWIEPDALARPLKALHIPGEHAVNSALLLDRLRQAFIGRGGRLVTDEAVELIVDHDRMDGVVLASGDRLSGRTVIVAAGARTQLLLDGIPDLARTVPPLVSGYGVSVLLDTTPAGGRVPRSVIRTPNRAFACGLHVVPRGPGQVYVGATNIISADPVAHPVVRDVHFLLDCAVRQVHRGLWHSPVTRTHVGNRPVSLDGYPLIGQAGPDGLWILTGTYRDGLTLSPLLAPELARRILGDAAQLDLGLFSPVRAPIQSMERHEIVRTTVTHTLAVGYESNWHLPVDWPTQIEHNMYRELTFFADSLHPVFTPPPEILATARHNPRISTRLRHYYDQYDAAGSGQDAIA
ncbi:NAD(P)/FAD-dependent oxidoreductase [Nonomuraea lactucae]|uniref:NAD(P)/FAD-dependent oxidoreductase n=1 Tax=Nonomuraea lactucae TaxID=2249762 RepID=UPI000DE439A4|nr:FAD-dependent oxidoreductase [Nonomuraea lactucae]